MPRGPLNEVDRERGRRVAMTLKRQREAASRTAADLAASAQVPVDTLRAIESGRIPTPSFLTVAALGRALDISLDELATTAWADA